MKKKKTTIIRPQSRGDSRFVRVLTMLVLLLMTVTGARAEATIVNGQTETSYTSLKEALEVVKDGDVIKLDWNATMTEGVETATESEFEAALAAPGIYRFTSAAPAAENVTNIIFNNLGLENAYDLTSTTLTVGNINLDFAKGTGTTTPAFYTSGGGNARLYKGNTMSVDAGGATITKIVFTYSSDVTPAFSTGSYTSSSKTWEGEATTLTVTNAYTTNTQIRIKSMDVYYSVASAAGEATYKVTVNDGGKDADKWTITPAEATTTGVKAGTEIKATYSGTKRVKSVKAEKKVATITITGDGHSTTLKINGCTTWADVVTLNPEVLSISPSKAIKSNDHELNKGNSTVHAGDTFDPKATDYKWVAD